MRSTVVVAFTTEIRNSAAGVSSKQKTLDYNNLQRAIERRRDQRFGAVKLSVSRWVAIVLMR